MCLCEGEGGYTLSKWLKEDLNSFICCWLMPLASRVRIWVSISLMVLAMVVRSNSQPTRICYRCYETCENWKRFKFICQRLVYFYCMCTGPYLHSVVGVFVIEHQGFLNQLVVSLQFVDVGLVSYNDMFELLQLGHLVLQGAADLQGAASNLLLGEHMRYTRSASVLDQRWSKGQIFSSLILQPVVYL